MKEVLMRFPYLWLITTGEIIFFCVFISILGWVFRKNSQSEYQELSQIPFTGEEQ